MTTFKNRAGLPGAAALGVFLVSVFANSLSVQAKDVVVAPLKPSDYLPTTGRTIAGPGLFTGMEGQKVFALNSGFSVNFKLVLPITACMTIVVLGDNNVSYSVRGTPGGFGASAAPGTTRAVCQGEASIFELECANGPCSAVWRIDEVNVGKSNYVP